MRSLASITFRRGRQEFIGPAKANPRFKFSEADLTNPEALNGILTAGIDRVFHLPRAPMNAMASGTRNKILNRIRS